MIQITNTRSQPHRDEGRGINVDFSATGEGFYSDIKFNDDDDIYLSSTHIPSQ